MIKLKDLNNFKEGFRLNIYLREKIKPLSINNNKNIYRFKYNTKS